MTSSTRKAIVWFRNDLRISDNPALSAAVETGADILPVFVHDEETPGRQAVGAAGRWWLHYSLAELSKAIGNLGAVLHIAQGPAGKIIPGLVQKTGADTVYWNRMYEPWSIARDKSLKSVLSDQGVSVESFNGSLLWEPWEVRTKQNRPFSVFTPFWKAECALGSPDEPLPAPEPFSGITVSGGVALADLNLLPTKPDWAGGLRDNWIPGETGARHRFAYFLDERVTDYPDTRNRPDISGTSRLSPHLHFGEISPRHIWHWSLDRIRRDGARLEKGVWAFLREIGWRDFNHNLLFNNPGMVDANYQTKFDAFPWQDDDNAFGAWSKGKTGFPIIDAGMRELWETGYMHNRVRMIVASFLVKDLLVPWQRGERWFRDTLVDADLANNVANWQWTAGCGADAAPYFRIFNPITQGRKFDPDGAYVRRWIPDLAKLPTNVIHAPWSADATTLQAAGVVLGRDYPHPILDHGQARHIALDAYEAVKGAA